ncbi:PadR family transcriptional regulator [Cellulomonas edaphi]|uniref:PadR family transcriptional regulator n=1 Tax=Cellulomonas edaphi TaxID=3053468 RepID=A0ABT7S3K8_9CELL|nr:PadR family transcriptional regulator [Cellulomons edaphi]MDM7830206.1 PadR family transcriptional regulator [Cellulomons edaphi]
MAGRTRNNPLALAVLALLWERPMHPYEMSMTLRERRKDESVRLNFGSLYSVVDSLVKHGLVEAASTEREGNRPQRTVYRITDAGAAEAVDWMTDLVQTPVKEFPQFEAALSFLPLLPPDDVARLLRLRAANLDRAITVLATTVDGARAQGLPDVFALEADYELAVLRAELGFVNGLAASIADGSLGGVELWRTLHAQSPGGRIDPDQLADALAPFFEGG